VATSRGDATDARVFMPARALRTKFRVDTSRSELIRNMKPGERLRTSGRRMSLQRSGAGSVGQAGRGLVVATLRSKPAAQYVARLVGGLVGGRPRAWGQRLCAEYTPAENTFMYRIHGTLWRIVRCAAHCYQVTRRGDPLTVERRGNSWARWACSNAWMGMWQCLGSFVIAWHDGAI
jgi:hypothetical protein